MDAFEKPTLVYRNGVHLLGTMVWFDPTRASEFCAISSAAQPRLRRHQRSLWSDRTARLVESQGGFSLSGLACPYRHSFNLGPLVFELIPSGYMPGACQYLLRFPSGYTLLYSGPFSMQESMTSEPIEFGQCDTMLLDATYGEPRFKFPPRSTVYTAIKEWISGELSDGKTPVLLVSNPGKAQDLISMLGSTHPIRTHPSIRRMNEAYASLDISLPQCRTLGKKVPSGDIIIWPRHLAASPQIQRLENRSTALVSGTPPSAKDGTLDAQHFAWSGRSDFREILNYVQHWKPKVVLTVGQYAPELARELVSQGIRATPLLKTAQMPLDL